MSNRSFTKSNEFKFGGYVSIATCALLGLLLASCSIFDDDEGQDEYEWIGKWHLIEENESNGYYHLDRNEFNIYTISEETCISEHPLTITDKDENTIEGIVTAGEDGILEIELMLEVSNGTLTMTILEYKSNGESIDREIGEQARAESIDSFPFDPEECE